MTGLSLFASNSGHTLARRLCAISALRFTGLARSVDPVTVRRLIMMWRQSTVTLLPCRKAMMAMRRSGEICKPCGWSHPGVSYRPLT